MNLAIEEVRRNPKRVHEMVEESYDSHVKDNNKSVILRICQLGNRRIGMKREHIDTFIS